MKLENDARWQALADRYHADIYGFFLDVLRFTPTWQQCDVIDEIQYTDCRVSISSGHGCFGLGTSIMKANGDCVPVESIVVGDQLMGDDGRSVRNVLELKRGQENMYRFTYADNTSHVFNESHILCLVATNSKGRRVAGQKTTVTVREWLTWGEDKKRCHAIYRSAVHDFGLTQELPIDPYILGVWLGDGTAETTCVTSEDIEVECALREYAKFTGLTIKGREGNSGNATDWLLRGVSRSAGNSMLKALQQLDLIGNKHIPDCYMKSSFSDRLELLGGLMDTDGHLDNKGAGFDFIQKNKVLAHQVAWLARSVGCHSTIREVTKVCTNNGVSGQYWRVTIGRNVHNIRTRVASKKLFNPVKQRPNLHFGIKSCESLGVGDYYGFVLDGNSQFLGGDFTVLHNTGKTTLAAAFALWKTVCFHKSIFMFTATKIDQLRRTTWKELRNFIDNIEGNPCYVWLADYFVLNADSIRIKDYDTGWQIFAQTASKGNPEALAGMHGFWYTVWADEASGIPADHFGVIEGALTETHNAFILSSQPTRDSGFFYDTHHDLSIYNGGMWTPIVLNSEESPRVTAKWVKNHRIKFGGVDSPEYWIKVLGKFPERLDEYLITQSGIAPCFEQTRVIDDSEFYGLFISVDVAAGVYRDSSVIMVGRVVGRGVGDGEKDVGRRAEVIDLPVYSKSINPIELAKRVIEVHEKYAKQAKVLLDVGGMGGALATLLRGADVDYHPVSWGNPVFGGDKKHYLNERAYSCVHAARAMREGRVRFLLPEFSTFKSKFMSQASRIPYYFDERARWCMVRKDKMKADGIASPDLYDALAFMFLPIDYDVVAKHNRADVAMRRSGLAL